jgi:hypothetical protein
MNKEQRKEWNRKYRQTEKGIAHPTVEARKYLI